MKKAIKTLAFIMLLGIVATGCKKKESNFVGNWRIDSYSYVWAGGSDLIPELTGEEWYFSSDGKLTGFFEGWIYEQYLCAKYGFDYVDEHEEDFEQQISNGGTLKTNYTYNNGVLTIEGGDLIAKYVIYDQKNTSEYVTKTVTFTYTLDVEHINDNSLILTGDFVMSERYSNDPEDYGETELVKIILTKN